MHDEFGEPVTAARVAVLRPRMVNRRRYLEPVGDGDQTDDTGAFRLHSLPAGEYYVTASARLAPPDSVVQTTLSPTYYPGTADFSAAQKVRVTPGADAFINDTRVDAILQYDAAVPGTPLPALTLPVDEAKPKFIALFPVGLGRTDQLVGGWKSGHLGQKTVGMMDIDDVSFVFASIERIESFLANHYFEILKEWPGPIVDETRRYAVGGPGTGGQLCYRLAAERPVGLPGCGNLGGSFLKAEPMRE